ncbi:hypothetical protein AC249_AIPGENE18299 [Exaiptasia diaphana]|nr:hypothetical protein AC249_AIPGENE18299 [Exaiptasia diaphana]
MASDLAEFNSDSDCSSSLTSLHGWLSEGELEDLEPIATEKEVEDYEKEVAREEEEERQQNERFCGEKDIKEWCKCGHCDLLHVVKPDECSCCVEYEKCRSELECLDQPPTCITAHPAFEDICLKKWVLEVAAVGLRTRNKRLYTKMRQEGRRTDSEFYRAVSYRQYMRFMYGYIGNYRLALPCCVYNKIRGKFPDENKKYRGFELEPEEEDDEEGESEDVSAFTYSAMLPMLKGSSYGQFSPGAGAPIIEKKDATDIKLEDKAVSPVNLRKFWPQPATNCNRRFLNGFRLRIMCFTTYQKSQKVPRREDSKNEGYL